MMMRLNNVTGTVHFIDQENFCWPTATEISSMPTELVISVSSQRWANFRRADAQMKIADGR